MRYLLLLLLSFSLAITCPAQQDSLATLLQEGMRLHDQGDYDGAIAKYDRIIATNSQYYLAYAEKSFSLFASGKYQDCADLCRKVLKEYSGNEKNGNIYVNYGSATDALGKPEEALKIYKEGIRKFPGYHLLYFNRGITEYIGKDYDDAVKDMEESLRLSPGHASSHQYLAYSIYPKNKIAAEMALVGFLLLEPTGQRAEKNLKLLLQILGANVQQKNDSNITISVNADMLNTKEKGEDDFHQTELMLSLTSAMDHSEVSKILTPAQLMEKKLEIFAEIKVGKKGFFSNFYVALFSDLKAANLLETASHVLYSSDKTGSDLGWLKDHQDRESEYEKWMQARVTKSN
jgi:tetratricopeptide (TPR) repeat protein